MENASKALLIGGAVLIAIVLISIGVYIISSQKGVIDQSKEASDVIAVKTFNSTFEKYIGTRKGSEVKELLSDRRVSNARNTQHQVQLGGTINDSSTINPNGNYEVSVGSDSYNPEGYIVKIYINPKT